MIANLLLWYLVLALAGGLAFPLAYRLLSFLPDRGWAFARPLGLLLWGYAFWLLASLKILQNNAGGALFALLLVGGVSAWVGRGRLREMSGWLRDNRRAALVGEVLFFAAFCAWAVVRASNPDASGTEKPMELAFINAILRSPAFPPADPWLSGYAISYYYFGYVMVALLARLSGAPGGVAFNLALVSWFAMTALAAYGLLYNLLSLRGARAAAARARDALWALLAPLFLLLVSNLEGFLEMLHARGLFWSPGESGELTSRFWTWLDIQEIVSPPAQPFGWSPNRPTGIWWWRASRVLRDYDLNGQSREIIDEFPMFSYALGDLHPHVLAMPFALLAAALALNIYLRLRAGDSPRLPLCEWLRGGSFWLAALVLGGMVFLNTWDWPIYIALFAAAAVLPRYLREGFHWDLLWDFLARGLALGLAGGILYLPFTLSFSSQAGGLLPSLVYFTRGAHFWIMFGALLLPLAGLLVYRWLQNRAVSALPDSLLLGLGLIGGLWLLSNLFSMVLFRAQPELAGIYAAGPGSNLLQVSLARRLAQPGAWISLILLFALVWGLFRAYRRPAPPVEDPDAPAWAVEEALANRAEPFVLLLALVGLGLVIFPEFFYLRDQFGWRMNTIFKFYFQAWILWAIAAGYATVVLWQEIRSLAGGLLVRAGLVLLVAAALAYPVFAIPDRAGSLDPRTWTLDGSDHLARYAPDELAAIDWLRAAPYGVVAEAVGGSYSGYARVSTHSGLPSVLGWEGHESQWRGGAAEMGSRKPDLADLFRARDWNAVQQVIEKYNIRYIYIGPLERGDYRPDETLFEQNLAVVFRNASVTIFEAPAYGVTPPTAARYPSQGNPANP